jgi:hypothetical protein
MLSRAENLYQYALEGRMVARNTLLSTPPYAVEQTLRRLGADLRTARVRRNMTIQEVGEKIGAGARAIMDAEKGKPSTSAAVYVGLLWAYGLLSQFDAVAAPNADEEGGMLALTRERSRARTRGRMSDDF